MNPTKHVVLLTSNIFGRGFDSRRLHHLSSDNFNILWRRPLISLPFCIPHQSLQLSQKFITRIEDFMKRFIVTGTPGSGKTAIIRQLECDGFSVVEEAATDVIALEQARGIAEPWTHPSFIDAVANLQEQRQMRASGDGGEVQFHDRSVVCTAALAAYLGHPLSAVFSRELRRIRTEAVYQPRVFFVGNLGFITPSQARRISFEEALRFERIHEETYRNFGFEIFSVEPGSVAERVAAIKAAIQAP
jgi:predicted ATPase